MSRREHRSPIGQGIFYTGFTTAQNLVEVAQGANETTAHKTTAHFEQLRTSSLIGY